MSQAIVIPAGIGGLIAAILIRDVFFFGLIIPVEEPFWTAFTDSMSVVAPALSR